MLRVTQSVLPIRANEAGLQHSTSGATAGETPLGRTSDIYVLPLCGHEGKDATDDFEDVGHSTSARDQLKDFLIGKIDPATLPSQTSALKPSTALPVGRAPSSSSRGLLTTVLQFLVPAAILALAVAVRYITKRETLPKTSAQS